MNKILWKKIEIDSGKDMVPIDPTKVKKKLITS